jgi:hypothetical protein
MPRSQEIHPGFETRSLASRAKGGAAVAVAQRKVRHNFGSYPCDAVANAQAVKHFRFTAAIKIAIVYYLRASISDLHVLRGKGEEVLLGMSP